MKPGVIFGTAFCKHERCHCGQFGLDRMMDSQAVI